MKNSFSNKIIIGLAVVAVIAAGFVLTGRGSQLSGTAEAAVKASVNGSVQEITTELTSGGYPDIVVQAGVPVKWNLKADADVLNSCNNALVIPEYGIEKNLQPGDNIIEFTPDKSGAVPYSCWMGMIRAQINVVDDIVSADAANFESAPAAGASAGCCRTDGGSIGNGGN